METLTKNKEERSEYLTVWVTPTLKKEMDFAKDNPELRENILKRYLSNEKDFMEQEISEIDNITVKYKARLIGIKENFEKAQSIYVEEIEKLYSNVHDADNKIKETLRSSNSLLDTLQHSLDYIKKGISNIDISRINEANRSIETLMNTVERFNKMPESEKELLKLLMSK